MSSLIGAPICDVCELELSHFADDDERRDDEVVDAAERISGKSWDECRIAIFQDDLDHWLRIKVEQPEEHFRRTMEALDWSRKQCEEDIERKIGVLKEKIERLDRA